MNDTRFDCLCAGIVVADHVCEPIDHLPQAGELVLTGRTNLTIGGCAANVAVDLARLGRKAAVVGRVGDDFFGQFVADALEQTGVDSRHLRKSPGEATSCSMIVNVRGEDRRFIHACGANRTLSGAEISQDMLRQTRVVYVGGYCLSEQPSPENIAALFRSAVECGVKTVLDVVIPQPGNYWTFLEPVLTKGRRSRERKTPSHRRSAFEKPAQSRSSSRAEGRGPSPPSKEGSFARIDSRWHRSTARAAATPLPPDTYTLCSKGPMRLGACRSAAHWEQAACGPPARRRACSTHGSFPNFCSHTRSNGTPSDSSCRALVPAAANPKAADDRPAPRHITRQSRRAAAEKSRWRHPR
jgi:hypothetical protein